MNQSNVVVLPIWKSELEEYEITSIEALDSQLSTEYHICIITKESLRSFIENHYILKKYEILIFEDKYLTYQGYNNLLRSSEFYRKFTDYNYLLIYQLDCLVFSKSLNYWINKNYDYVGSPWFTIKNNSISFYKVGNGGLSLRKISSFIQVCNEYKKPKVKIRLFFANLINSISVIFRKIFINRDTPEYHVLTRNEDVFFSHLGKELFPDFEVSTYEDALLFSFDKYPRECFYKNENSLPFGCHAFNKYDTEFWNDVYFNKLNS